MRRTIGNYQKAYLELAKEYSELKLKEEQVRFNLEGSNDALIEARTTLEKFGWSDCPFLDDGIAAVASECSRLENELHERLTFMKNTVFNISTDRLKEMEVEWLEKTLERPKKPNWLSGELQDPKGEQK